ncbi:hypothetical protein Tsubulata_008210 [Turnera subulata]|uniref:RNA polymerase sigma-70 domain-containing protein n=1 Tax=Turnera subulata TaxID=218843 RepID=A0A9Q0J3E1_9ROSI|nr:hypothetical protein Tsubulata_008210 [Turnera subulata]
MMATTAVIGLSAGKRLLSSSFYYSDLTERLSSSTVDHGVPGLYHVPPSKNVIVAKKSNSSYGLPPSNRNTHYVKALKEDVVLETLSAPVTEQTWYTTTAINDMEEQTPPDVDFSLKELLLLQKTMLEKQWNLSFTEGSPSASGDSSQKKFPVTSSGVSARQRRMNARMKNLSQTKPTLEPSLTKHLKSAVDPDLLRNRWKGNYVKGEISEELLAHKEVVKLSRIVKIGLSLEKHKKRLEARLGREPSDKQLAASLGLTRAQLQSKLIECSLARERLAMCNVRLVFSVAQKYDNMGAEMGDLVQGGLIGLLRGIEKFDSSKGCKLSTYVYWWIRQGVGRALAESSTTLRLPYHLHERLGLIRSAKVELEGSGITPSIERIAETLNMSEQKVRNATEACSKIVSLDREAFPSLSGLAGKTLHSYIADDCLENNPWHGLYKLALKEEVDKLINSTLRERERDIIRLYYGLDKECLTWEEISKRKGLSRERVRQVGLVALEKLKHAASKSNLDAVLLQVDGVGLV